MQLTAIIPCRNEAPCIGGLLDDLGRQTVDGFTVVVADGMSDDGTWELLQRRVAEARDPFRLVVVRNPDRTIPHALNRAVEASPDGLIIRIDAHGRIPPDYLQRMAEALQTDAGILAGPRIRMVPGGDGAMAEVIAGILNSPLGNGGTPSRGGVEAPRAVAHTVMSCWHRSAWVGNGGFDESLLTNEDFDFDWRARARGLRVLSLPAPVYELSARRDLASLARQRWRYGWWKAVVLRRHPGSVHARQLLPVAALAAVPPLAIWAPAVLAGCAAAWLLLAWLVALRSAAIRSQGALSILVRAPLAAASVQFVWAAGVVAGLALNRPGRPRLRGIPATPGPPLDRSGEPR